MFAVCIEASHARGMGHFYRALNIISYLQEKGEAYILLMNKDEAAEKILLSKKIPYETVDFSDEESNWESVMIRNHHISVWLNDKFESGMPLCRHVKEQNIVLAAIDDRGEGAGILDVHFAGMLFGRSGADIPGGLVFEGLQYNVLNPDIEKYRRKRSTLERVIVTLGGSDTYGATVLAVKYLKKYGCPADIILGANFRHEKELERELNANYRVFHTVPSLMETFSEYDLAVTGGGVTCLEANAAGLPCVIIANEPHEVDTGKYMESQGGALFAGYYKDINEKCFDLKKLDIRRMSECALCSVSLRGRENIYRKLKRYEERFYGNR